MAILNEYKLSEGMQPVNKLKEEKSRAFVMRKIGKLQEVEWIPSKDIKQYWEKSGYKLADFEKTAIIYNSLEEWHTICLQLEQIKEETQDRILAAQIEERLCFDKTILSQIRKSTDKEIFLLEVYDKEIEDYNKFLFISFEQAELYGRMFGEEFCINKLRLNGKENIPTEKDDRKEYLGYMTYNKYGDIASFDSYEPVPMGFSDMDDPERFEHAYITVPYPFKKGDIVRDTRAGDIGIVYSPENWQEGDTYLRQHIMYKDFDSVQLNVEFLSPDGKFVHRHICPIFLEFADIQNLEFDDIPKNEFYKRVTKAASDMVRGKWPYPIGEFQLLFLEYLDNQKEK